MRKVRLKTTQLSNGHKEQRIWQPERKKNSPFGDRWRTIPGSDCFPEHWQLSDIQHQTWQEGQTGKTYVSSIDSKSLDSKSRWEPQCYGVKLSLNVLNIEKATLKEVTGIQAVMTETVEAHFIENQLASLQNKGFGVTPITILATEGIYVPGSEWENWKHQVGGNTETQNSMRRATKHRS